MGAQENKLQNLQISQNEILRKTILPVLLSSCEILKFIFSDSHKKLSLVLSQITNIIIFLSLKSVKKMG